MSSEKGNEHAKKERTTIEETTNCPECASDHIIRDYERGELICGDCGIVINDLHIDMGPEWRAFDSAQTEQSLQELIKVLELILNQAYFQSYINA